MLRKIAALQFKFNSIINNAVNLFPLLIISAHFTYMLGVVTRAGV